jgi:DNA-binding response OmpR family regulator
MEIIKLLLVEDDTTYRKIIKSSLEITGKYTIYEAKNGLEGYESFKSLNLDIIVTDIDMPKVSGLEMIDLIRRVNENIPIIIASAMIRPDQIKEGFEHDIDGFVKKPYSTDELDGTIKSVFKRIKPNSRLREEDVKFIDLGSYSLDMETRRLTCQDRNIVLSKRETQILYVLHKNKSQLVKKNYILKKFWGEGDAIFQARSLDVFINKLRNCLEQDKTINISTIRGEGYILDF